MTLRVRLSVLTLLLTVSLLGVASKLVYGQWQTSREIATSSARAGGSKSCWGSHYCDVA